MIPYARLTPGPGFRPERALGYYLQRLVTAPTLRRPVCSLIAAAVRRRHGDGPDAPPQPGRLRALSELQRDGVTELAPILTAREIADMRAFFEAEPVLAPRGQRMKLDALGPDVGMAAYPLATVLACPGIMRLLNAPLVLQVAAGYLGCAPTISSVGVRWSFPRKADRRVSRTQQFHRDLDDWRFVKLFVYLTDVDEESGPHCYVRGSHTTAFGLAAQSYEEAALLKRYGAGAMTAITGPAGTTFMADTLGIHRGASPATRPRLILQVQYSLMPIFAFDYEPPASTVSPSDAYWNRLICPPTSERLH